MIPGEYHLADEPIVINADRPTIEKIPISAPSNIQPRKAASSAI